jgi:hypothetical protein
MQLMGIAEFIIAPVEDRTRWLNPSYALRAHNSNMLVAACSMSAMTPTATKNCSAAQRRDVPEADLFSKPTKRKRIPAIARTFGLLGAHG